MQKESFQNQVIWITGASSGIGEAMARTLAARGARVILTARRTERLESLAREINAPFTGELRAQVLAADLSQITRMDELTEAAIRVFGRIDILFNNAGISQRSLVRDTSFAVEQRMIELDLLSPIALTKCVLPHLLKQGGGRIWVTSSLMGELELPGSATYACVKHGLNGYFYSLAFELAPHRIAVQVLEPGFVRTEISESAVTANGERYGKMDSTQANGLSAEVFANRAVRALEKGHTSVRIGGKETLAIWLKRFSPRLYRLAIVKFSHRLLKDRLSLSGSKINIGPPG